MRNMLLIWFASQERLYACWFHAAYTERQYARYNSHERNGVNNYDDMIIRKAYMHIP